MIIRLLILLTLLTAVSAHAESTFNCYDKNGDSASLKILNAKQITWFEQRTSAGSSGVLTMLTSPWENKAVYILSDFFRDQSSFFALAVPFNAISGVKDFEVVSYRDKNGSPVESNVFQCKLN